MKKAVFLTILAVFACTGLFAQQPVVAVAPFDAISGISATDANMITRVFFIRLGNTNKVSLVDRNVVEQVLKEHKFQTSDWSNQQKTAELNKGLNADWIVRGELEKFGSNILVTVQFYDLQTFKFMGGGDLRIANADAAYDNMQPLVDKLVETIASTGGNRPAARPASGNYKIGDTGPGGGMIFFAEGGNFLEVSGELGIVTYDEARRLTKEQRGGGFIDWRLPTMRELRLMYENLVKNGLGGFFPEHYWSSEGRNWTQDHGNGRSTVWYYQSALHLGTGEDDELFRAANSHVGWSYTTVKPNSARFRVVRDFRQQQ